MTQSGKELFDELIKKHLAKALVLKEIFPEYAVDKTPFVTPGTVFYRSSTKNKYMILMDRKNRTLIMANITLGYVFQNIVPATSKDMSVPVTIEQLKALTGNNHKQYHK